MIKFALRPAAWWLLCATLLLPRIVIADIPGVAPGIPEPEHRNVIVQLFNWTFNDIKGVIPTLKTLGYSHVHVSPPQKSNEQVWQWWGRYQPIDYGQISGPLGNEAEFAQMNDVAEQNGIQIIADVVLNHTVDVREAAGLVRLEGNRIVEEMFPQFEPHHFHDRCPLDDHIQQCWLENNLADLKTEDAHVRSVAKDYLGMLARLGVDGYRFDASIHIETNFYPDVLSVVPDKFAFGEIIRTTQSDFSDYIAIDEMDYYDFPLVAIMRDAFAFGGDLRKLKNPQDVLDGPKAITFVRNHDVERGQNDDRGIMDGPSRRTFGIGWNEEVKGLDRTDVQLAYAFVFGREDRLPYVFADMNTLPEEQQDDRFNDPFVIAAIRFHNLCLANTGGVARRPDVWRIEEPNTIGWQRGDDRFIVINKAGGWYDISNLQTSLQPGEYKEVRTGWPMHVQSDGIIQHWSVPPRSATMFVRLET